LDTLARNVAAMGVRSIELVDPKSWPILKKHGLICALANSHGFVEGFNRKENHAMCIEKITAAVDACAAAGFPTVITFSGFRKGLPDDIGLENTIAGLKKVIGYAEKKKINLCLEVLNSRVDVEMKGHPDYMCDKVEWAVEVCRRIASPRMTFLFDIYHVQIMQGDIITRIKKFHEYIGHYHTAGVPGRNEIDENQELNYPAIMRVVAETGYKGYVGVEFIPTRDPMQTLRAAVRLCDV
jgi:hydroxypyruvate isomerase